MEHSRRAPSAAHGPRKLFIERPAGGRVATIDFGGSGRPCLLVHGAGLNALCFSPLAAALVNKFRCVGVDLSGHGRSDTPSQIEWRVFADDVTAAADALGADAIGVGHSLGASALLDAEASRPGTFAEMFCYEPIVIDEAMPDRPPSGASAQAARRRKQGFSSREEAFERFSTRPPFASFDQAALSGYLDEGLIGKNDGTVLLACSPDTEAAIYESAADFDLLGVLDRVACPVTVAFGGSSSVMSRAGAEAVVSRLARGQVEQIPGLDHFGPFSSPDAVADAVFRALRTAAA